MPLAWKESEQEGYGLKSLSEEEVSSGRLIKIIACGLGCVLISTKVLKKIEFRHDDTLDVFDDMLFSKDCSLLNIDMYVDTSLKCKHLIKNRPWSWQSIDPPKNKPIFKKESELTKEKNAT